MNYSTPDKVLDASSRHAIGLNDFNYFLAMLEQSVIAYFPP